MENNGSENHHFSREIGFKSLQIGAIALNAQKPFTWASGYRMPIYNDNRMLLGDYKHRHIVTTVFEQIIKDNTIEFDCILGTSLAGIAPASSLAAVLEKSLIILNDGKAYENVFTYYDRDPLNSVDKFLLEDIDVVASPVPWGIYNGVNVANSMRKPFIYIRPEKKDHGKQKQVEGILNLGQKVGFIETYNDEISTERYDTMKPVSEAGGVFGALTSVKNKFHESDIKGRRILVIEDLISTGGSSAKEVAAARSLGAHADNIISIFTYGLDEAKAQFEKIVPGCKTYSILDYDTLIDVAISNNMLKEEDRNLLLEWRADPFNWGQKHGFPKVEKK